MRRSRASRLIDWHHTANKTHLARGIRVAGGPHSRLSCLISSRELSSIHSSRRSCEASSSPILLLPIGPAAATVSCHRCCSLLGHLVAGAAALSLVPEFGPSSASSGPGVVDGRARERIQQGRAANPRGIRLRPELPSPLTKLLEPAPRRAGSTRRRSCNRRSPMLGPSTIFAGTGV